MAKGKTAEDILLPLDLMTLQQRAWEYAQKSNPILPDPESLVPLLRPMVFKRKRIGNFQIVTETSDTFDVTNQRMAVLLGVRLLKVRFPEPTSFHLLQHMGQTMTSDKPIEIYQQYCSFVNMRGRVLVGGLGLGMAAEMIRANPAVKEIVVVEKSKTIIDLVGPQLHKTVTVVRADLFEYMKTVPARRFDSAYFDIWYRTGEQEWSEYVLPLYRAARRKGITILGAWGEFEMNWQLRTGLHRLAFLDTGTVKLPTFLPYTLWRRGLADYYGHPLPCRASAQTEVERLLELYLTGIGTPEWEKVWGRPADTLVP